MNIKRTSRPTSSHTPHPAAVAVVSSVDEGLDVTRAGDHFQSSGFDVGTIGAGLSVSGGLVLVAGALVDSPLVTMAGGVASLAGVGLSYQSVRNNHGRMDLPAWVSVAAATALPLAGAAILASPGAPPVGPQGPLPQLLRQLGVKALPM